MGLDLVERSNARTRVLRNEKIEKWLQGDIESLAIVHHINYVWGKKIWR